ncbi:hypothetical protein DIPPA_25080 [Diplonema papillatum]|nr:hypothetical protein DIPPA_25080 [Diplonema papillatum]
MSRSGTVPPVKGLESLKPDVTPPRDDAVAPPLFGTGLDADSLIASLHNERELLLKVVAAHGNEAHANQDSSPDSPTSPSEPADAAEAQRLVDLQAFQDILQNIMMVATGMSDILAPTHEESPSNQSPADRPSNRRLSLTTSRGNPGWETPGNGVAGASKQGGKPGPDAVDELLEAPGLLGVARSLGKLAKVNFDQHQTLAASYRRTHENFAKQVDRALEGLGQGASASLSTPRVAGGAAPGAGLFPGLLDVTPAGGGNGSFKMIDMPSPRPTTAGTPHIALTPRIPFDFSPSDTPRDLLGGTAYQDPLLQQLTHSHIVQAKLLVRELQDHIATQVALREQKRENAKLVQRVEALEAQVVENQQTIFNQAARLQEHSFEIADLKIEAGGQAHADLRRAKVTSAANEQQWKQREKLLLGEMQRMQQELESGVNTLLSVTTRKHHAGGGEGSSPPHKNSASPAQKPGSNLWKSRSPPVNLSPPYLKQAEAITARLRHEPSATPVT